MRNAFVALMLAISIAFSTASPAFAKDKKFVEQVKAAVGILYSQDSQGTMHMHCTVTAFEKLESEDAKTKVKTPRAYRFVTAAHCVGEDETTKERSANAAKTPFFITYDESGKEPKRFWPAKAIFVGYQSRGEDFTEFEVQSTENWPIVPLGNEKDAKDGDEILNVASPLGLGKQVFDGTITSVYLDRPIIQGDINWKGSVALQLPGTNGGSSGSTVVHYESKKIVAILVGSIGGTTITAIPISRFIAVRKAVSEKKYKYYQPTVETNPDGSEVQ